MTDEPKETRKTAEGHSLYGPSGVAVWSTPTVDAKRGLLYVTTGDNYSDPATATSDAVIALDLADGHVVWLKQITPGDAYNGACRIAGANCPANPGPDHDFGSSAVLIAGPGGRDVLLAGRSPASSLRSIRSSRARSCGRRASAKAARTEVCSGAWPRTARACTPRFPTLGARAKWVTLSIRAATFWIQNRAADSLH